MLKTTAYKELHTKRQKDRCYSVLKRGFDFLFSLLCSLLLLIPLALLSILIMLKDPGSPFYFHCRVGRNGKPFRLLKLRSMKKNADNLLDSLSAEQMSEYLKEFKLEDDPRLIGYRKAGNGRTCFGAVLRRLSLDELPQVVWNILIKGDMSFVGPRPVLREELDKYYTPEEQKMLLAVKPGLTGYWQAYARNDAHYSDGNRQQMELYYVQNRSIWLDVKILFATVGAVLQKRGV